MKKFFLIFVVFVLVLGILFLPKFFKNPSAVDDVSSDPASVEVESNLTSAEMTPDPVFVSDPLYGDEITQDELDQLQAEDEIDNGISTYVVGEEFVIELGETQGIAGF